MTELLFSTTLSCARCFLPNNQQRHHQSQKNNRMMCAGWEHCGYGGEKWIAPWQDRSGSCAQARPWDDRGWWKLLRGNVRTQAQARRLHRQADGSRQHIFCLRSHCLCSSFASSFGVLRFQSGLRGRSRMAAVNTCGKSETGDPRVARCKLKLLRVLLTAQNESTCRSLATRTLRCNDIKTKSEVLRNYNCFVIKRIFVDTARTF